ncbi:MAG: hypothetical protein GTO18_01530 [Anaerolineales bacterium]|nr:hypothetical protein [Anaerolineales bacterium]
MSNQLIDYHEITLLRHGESLANQAQIVQGQQDHPLSQLGRQQVKALATHWSELGKSFDLIISSPLSRALETAQTISEAIPCPIEEDKRWMERNFGNAEGLDYDSVREWFDKNQDRSPFDIVFDSGESDWEVYIRAANALQTLLRKPKGRYLVVSHGGILNAAVHCVLGIALSTAMHRPRFQFTNTGHSTIQYNWKHFRWIIHSFNDVSHLNPTEDG